MTPSFTHATGARISPTYSKLPDFANMGFIQKAMNIDHGPRPARAARPVPPVSVAAYGLHTNFLNFHEQLSMLCHTHGELRLIDPAIKIMHLFAIKSCNSSRTAPPPFSLGWLFPMLSIRHIFARKGSNFIACPSQHHHFLHLIFTSGSRSFWCIFLRLLLAQVRVLMQMSRMQRN